MFSNGNDNFLIKFRVIKEGEKNEKGQIHMV